MIREYFIGFVLFCQPGFNRHLKHPSPNIHIYTLWHHILLHKTHGYLLLPNWNRTQDLEPSWTQPCTGTYIWYIFFKAWTCFVSSKFQFLFVCYKQEAAVGVLKENEPSEASRILNEVNKGGDVIVCTCD